MIVSKEWDLPRFIIYSIILGSTSYLIVQLFVLIFCHGYEISIWKNLSQKENIPFLEVIYATISAIFLSFILSWFDKYKLIFKLGGKIGLTRKYGEDSAFMYYLNSSDADEVYVRDFKTQITFHGMVDIYNESSETKEIVLKNVTAYTSEKSIKLYSTRFLYLCRPKDDMHIEVAQPYIPTNSGEKNVETVPAPKADK